MFDVMIDKRSNDPTVATSHWGYHTLRLQKHRRLIHSPKCNRNQTEYTSASKQPQDRQRVETHVRCLRESKFSGDCCNHPLFRSCNYLRFCQICKILQDSIFYRENKGFQDFRCHVRKIPITIISNCFSRASFASVTYQLLQYHDYYPSLHLSYCYIPTVCQRKGETF